MRVDMRFQDHGSIVLLHTESTAGQDWLDDHVDVLAARWWFGSVAVEPRRAVDIAIGANNDGLAVEWLAGHGWTAG